jgi:hypothetical protein
MLDDPCLGKLLLLKSNFGVCSKELLLKLNKFHHPVITDMVIHSVGSHRMLRLVCYRNL